jgi:uncharacterized protein DUF4260
VIDRLPRVLLRLEGLAVLVGSLVLYFHADFGWLLLVVLFFAPDLSFAAYGLGPRLGSVAYDALHTEIFPVALGVAGVVAGSERSAQLALIWLGHIGMDRALGYGLKYATAFKDTHLGRV